MIRSLLDEWDEDEEKEKPVVNPDAVNTGLSAGEIQSGFSGAANIAKSSGGSPETTGALGGAAAGASLGSAGGPVGAAVGAVVGMVSGLLGGSAKRKKENKAIKAQSLSNFYTGQMSNQENLAQGTRGSFRDLMQNYNSIF